MRKRIQTGPNTHAYVDVPDLVGPCQHLGEATGEVLDCEGCGGKKGLPVHTCSVHKKCSPQGRLIAKGQHIISCLECQFATKKGLPNGGYKPIPTERPRRACSGTGVVRHLLYHIYPKQDSNWQWNVRELRRRMSLFNGRRIIGIATGPETESVATVCAAFSGCGCEFVEATNVPKLREAATFLALHARIARFSSLGDVFFYGHAKGITSEAWAPGSRRWTTAMYEACLDHWPTVQRLLEQFPTVGPFLRDGYGFPECQQSEWHFSGGFRWTRSADFFASPNWHEVPQNWIGAEAHPSLIFHRPEAGCLVHPFRESGLALYTEDYWKSQAGPAVERWRKTAVVDRLDPLLMTCVLVSHNKPRRIHEAIGSVLAQSSPDWQLVVIDSGSLVGELRRYETDARVRVVESPIGTRCQGWQINECVRRGWVLGDLICYLSDDDVYSPDAFAAFLAAARAAPKEMAWYGAADRCELRDSGEIKLGELNPGVIGGLGGVSLNCQIDGIQVCHRRELCARAPWPEGEDPETRRHADGHFLDRLGQITTIRPLAVTIGRHRHCPESAFTQSG